jgi:hypothetical protein
MCYRKPGPRCSGHASATLRKAQVAFIASQEYSDYVAMREAEEEYDLTPAGQAHIQDQMDQEEDFEKKYLLEQRLKIAKEKREAALDAIREVDQGDVEEGHETPKRTSVPTSLLKNTEFNPPMNSTSGIDCEYDDYGCSQADCDGYYCHDRVYTGLRIDSVDEREFLAGQYGVEADKVPTGWVNRVKELGLHEHAHVEGVWNYYGEVMQVTVSSEMQSLVSDIYHEQPNAVDAEGALEYARQEGVDTTGLRAVEATKETIPEGVRRPRAITDAVRKSQTVAKKRMRVENIVVPSAANDATPYDFSKVPSGGISGGVIVEVNGQMHLVGGFERFKAVQAKGNKFWSFHQLS